MTVNQNSRRTAKPVCRVVFAEAFIEGMRDPENKELEPGFSLEPRLCGVLGCTAYVAVFDNIIVVQDDTCPEDRSASPDIEDLEPF